MASFTPLLESLKQCGQGPYHLVRGNDQKWRVVAGVPAQNEVGLLDEVAKELQNASLSLDEQDALEHGMRKLTLEPPSNGLWGLFSKTVKSEETTGFQNVKQALELNFNRLVEAGFDEIKRSLEYLAQKDDLCRFALLYRTASEKFQDELTAFLSELSLKPALNSCLWLQRAKENFAWIRSLVPIAALKAVPKRLDLKDCELKSIAEVLQAHKNQGYSQLVLELNCSQEYLWHLIEQGFCDSVIELDIQGCSRPTWKYLDGRLAHLPKLRAIHLPANIFFGAEPICWSARWNTECKAAVSLEVQRVYRQQHANEDFTFVTDLMRGVEQKRELNYKNRVQLNLLLTAGPEVLKTLRPLSTVSASGIQRVTADMIIQLPLAEKDVNIFLSYCPLITKEAFKHLYIALKPRLLNLYFWGCSQIDDSYFEDHPLLTQPNTFKGALMLVGTRVTLSMRQRLQSAQPRAIFKTDASFLPNLAKIKEAVGVDPQGLSDDAMKVILHLKHTGYFPPVSVATAKELIASQNTILEPIAVRQELKQFCRSILLINVERSNVLDLYAFAGVTDDSELKFVCKVFLESYLTPDLPAAWATIPDEEKRMIEPILKTPLLPVPTFDDSDETMYGKWDPDKIQFSLEARPLGEIVLFGTVQQFLMRYEKMSADERRECLAKYQALYPQKRWLKRLQEEPEWPKKLFPLPNVPRQVLDLRGVESIAAPLLLRSCGGVPVEVSLSFTDQDFIVLKGSVAFEQVTFLDLRECEVTRWENLQEFLLGCPLLRNVILPTNLNLDRAGIKISPKFSPELHLLLRLNLMHHAALTKKMVTYFYLLSSRRPDSSVELVANIAILEAIFDTIVDYPEPYALNFLFQTVRPLNIKRLWPHDELNLSGIEAARSNLLRIQETRAYALNLSYCRTIDWGILAGKQLTTLSLFGCSQVDDSYFSTVPQVQMLDLRGTCVTSGKAAELRQLGYQVLYDPDFLATYQAGCKASRDHLKLSRESCFALNHYRYTGYFPLLTVPVAMELYCNEVEDELLSHCLKYMLLNVSREHALSLYRLAKEKDNSSLLYVVRCFIEIFCNPYYPLKKDEAFDLTPFEEVLRDPFPTPRAIHTAFILEKQKITEKPNLEVQKPGDKSANVDREDTIIEDDL